MLGDASGFSSVAPERPRRTLRAAPAPYSTALLADGQPDMERGQTFRAAPCLRRPMPRSAAAIAVHGSAPRELSTCTSRKNYMYIPLKLHVHPGKTTCTCRKNRAASRKNGRQPGLYGDEAMDIGPPAGDYSSSKRLRGDGASADAVASASASSASASGSAGGSGKRRGSSSSMRSTSQVVSRLPLAL